MPKVVITCPPRQGGFTGYGAIGEYFQCGQSVTRDVTEAQLLELNSDPAIYFLKVEDAGEAESRGLKAQSKAAEKK